ncbi:hypothetical protein NBH00_14835 [Paraconexibacter antarcticus]|uniref:Uncharacterized protein n=1 Tax=Paraconexibacter antarcticus TaxID=2949664 RepID=A0ABY5DLE0_9ACTN|nr:hypothetical protein [Paraconexibacter antarcticus]UTI62633.1 hypothetical protein NBH00_14835 [Paraconexibacter antarcticus]
MAWPTPDAGGSRTVEPRTKHRSKRKPRAADARRLARRIEEASAELRAHDAGPRETTSTRLQAMHADKRAMRRDIYADAPQLEGSRTYRTQPRTGS